MYSCYYSVFSHKSIIGNLLGNNHKMNRSGFNKKSKEQIAAMRHMILEMAFVKRRYPSILQYCIRDKSMIGEKNEFYNFEHIPIL